TPADVALLDELAELLGREDRAVGNVSGQRASELAGESFQLVETALAEEMQAALENRTADCPRCQLEMEYGRASDGTLTLTCTNTSCPGGTYPAHDIIGDDAAQFLPAIIEELSDRYAELDVSTPRIADRHYHHIVVDEGQDVSAMQWRAIARRCPSLALTVVGDLDQASQPWSIHDWSPVFTLAGAEDAELVQLTVNYRTPSEVMELAAKEVARRGRSVSAPEAIRSSGMAPQVRRGTIGELDALLAEARRAVGDAGTVVAVVPE